MFVWLSYCNGNATCIIIESMYCYVVAVAFSLDSLMPDSIDRENFVWQEPKIRNIADLRRGG